MNTPPLNLNHLVDDALRGVVRQALAHVAEHGVYGDQQFLVDFRTDEDGVQIPSWLREQFPEQIRVVLQHQFWNLDVDDEGFSVDLRFGGTPATVFVPFAAIEAFVDPSVPFGLSFHRLGDDEGEDEDGLVTKDDDRQSASASDDTDDDSAETGNAEVVQIDAFRKR